jgi:hypothetical protein
VGKGKLNEWQVLWVDISRLDDGFVSDSRLCEAEYQGLRMTNTWLR